MKIVAISPNRKNIENLPLALTDMGGRHSVQLFEGGRELLALLADQEAPDLIIIECAGDGQETVEALKGVSQSHPHIMLIMLCEKVTAESVIQAVRIGVQDVLETPIQTQALKDAVTRIERKMGGGEKPKHKGKVLAFIACKGGSGATFLASNLGYALAAECGKRVALIDLNMQFGDASLFVSEHPPAYTIAQVAHEISRLDASLLASFMLQVRPNYGVLAAPENPARAADVLPVHVQALLRLAVTEYDYVILDMGRTLDAVSIKALDHADMIFPVLQETLPFIRDAKRMISTLQSLDYNMDKIHLVLNRYEKGGDVQLDDVERTLNTKMAVIVPNSFKAVSASVNQGVPILELDSKDVVAKCLLKFAHELEQDEKREHGWFAKLFTHGK